MTERTTVRAALNAELTGQGAFEVEGVVLRDRWPRSWWLGLRCNCPGSGTELQDPEAQGPNECTAFGELLVGQILGHGVVRYREELHERRGEAPVAETGLLRIRDRFNGLLHEESVTEHEGAEVLLVAVRGHH